MKSFSQICYWQLDLGRIYTIVTNIYENSARVKTNGNFGGFPIGKNIFTNFGISLGNPHICAICKTYLLYAGSRLPIPVLCIYAAAVTAAAAKLPTWYSRDTMLSSF